MNRNRYRYLCTGTVTYIILPTMFGYNSASNILIQVPLLETLCWILSFSFLPEKEHRPGFIQHTVT